MTAGPTEETAAAQEGAGGSPFALDLAGFSGPFDLLLRLIARHELDLVEISLSRVTDEFISYVQALDEQGRLEESSEFIGVAATLLDMKIAELLPRGEVVDPEDVALLEARDLLFARLLQYRAFKQVAQWFHERIQAEQGRHTRDVPLDVKRYQVVPDVRIPLSVADFAALAVIALTPREAPVIGFAHLHAPAVSVREQAALVVSTLRQRGSASFSEIVADTRVRGEVVARFVAVLELYRVAAVAFEQLEPLGALTIRWVAQSWDDEQLSALGADYDHADERK
ncbi:MAG TPA: segregation/condensation protein A [Pseudoclavibacter sp.]|nr:segregation/condensation protein A [Pseudoclavibacter sp.]